MASDQNFSNSEKAATQRRSPTSFFAENITQPGFTCSKLTIETLEQRYEICPKLTIKPPKRCNWRCFGGFTVNFEHIPHLCFSISIVNFEHVIADWERNFQNNSFWYFCECSLLILLHNLLHAKIYKCFVFSKISH